jgi:hypothetical protein
MPTKGYPDACRASPRPILFPVRQLSLPGVGNDVAHPWSPHIRETRMRRLSSRV